VFVHFQLGRLIFQDSRDVFADPVFHSPATATRLLPIRKIQLMPMVRQAGKIEFPTTATAGMPRNLLTRFVGFSNRRTFDVTRWRQIKQVLLAFPLNDPFPSASVDPALVPSELFQNGRVLLPEFFIGSSRFIEHAPQFRYLLPQLHRFLVGR
jgi:hypothetical protein